MTLDELAQYAERNNLVPGDLDEEVHEYKAEEAASLNNAGLDAQLHYLASVMSLEELYELLKDLVARPA